MTMTVSPYVTHDIGEKKTQNIVKHKEGGATIKSSWKTAPEDEGFIRFRRNGERNPLLVFPPLAVKCADDKLQYDPLTRVLANTSDVSKKYLPLNILRTISLGRKMHNPIVMFGVKQILEIWHPNSDY